MKRLMTLFSFVALMITANVTWAQANLDVNTPGITAITSSMKARNGQLQGAYASGAVGFSKDGNVTVRDAAALPLKDRAAINALVAQENQDRAALYKEIAKANNHPEWEGDIRNTFAQRFIQKAQAGWYVQDGSAAWVKK
ncbi:MAG: YdbL family protein [Burkholderiales bacterium]